MKDATSNRIRTDDSKAARRASCARLFKFAAIYGCDLIETILAQAVYHSSFKLKLQLVLPIRARAVGHPNGRACDSRRELLGLHLRGRPTAACRKGKKNLQKSCLQEKNVRGKSSEENRLRKKFSVCFCLIVFSAPCRSRKKRRPARALCARVR